MCTHITRLRTKNVGRKNGIRVLFDTQFTRVDFSISDLPFNVLETSVKVENRENVAFRSRSVRTKTEFSRVREVRFIVYASCRNGFSNIVVSLTPPNCLRYLILIYCLNSHRNKRRERETYFHGLQRSPLLVRRSDSKE